MTVVHDTIVLPDWVKQPSVENDKIREDNLKHKAGLIDKPKKALRYNKGKRKWSLIPWKALEITLSVFEYGAHKYSRFKGKNGEVIRGADIKPEEAQELELIQSGAHNWKLGLDEQECMESAMRHLTAMMEGEELDPESGLPHVGHLGCNTLFLSQIHLEKLNRIGEHKGKD
jgi:hypothetical protein